MSQLRYTMGVLKRFGMQNSKPAVTPMIEAFFTGLRAENDKTVVDAEQYRSMIGSLLYLALRSRPDIMVAVSILARFSQSPTAYCNRAAKRVLRYLRGSQTVVHLWGFKKQAAVALSTCEAEYHAMTVAAKEIIWLRRVLAEIRLGICNASLLMSDNQSAIAWAKGERFPLSRAKHVDVHMHFIRDLVTRGDVNVCYVPTNLNNADIMTKPVGPTILKEARRRIRILSIACSSAFEEE
eukprot:IDg18781t1